MTYLNKLSLAVFSTITSVTPLAAFAEEQKEGFIEGSTLTVLNRSFYMNRDHRNGESSPTGNGYSEAWAQGVIGRFESGFTQGTFGTDADYSNANSTYMRRDSDGNPLTDQKRWERDIEAKYIVQTGNLKDLSLRVRQATTRTTAFESDLDEVRLIVEYPLSVL